MTGAAIRPKYLLYHTAVLWHTSARRRFSVYTAPAVLPVLPAFYSCTGLSSLSIRSPYRLSDLVPAIAGWFSRRKFGLPRLIFITLKCISVKFFLSVKE